MKKNLPEEIGKLAQLEPTIDIIKSGALCEEPLCEQLKPSTTEAADNFLVEMNDFVFYIDNKFDSQIIRLSYIEYSLFALISLIMIFEFFGVIIPFQKTLDDENKKLIQAAKLSSLGEMSAGILHEINNPLTIIDGSAKVLKQTQTGESEKFVDNILDATHRMKKISDSLRQYSRSDSFDFTPQKVIVNDIIQEAIYFNSFSKKDFKKIEIFSKHIEDLMVEAEKSRLTQVFVNLIGNAIDAVSSMEEPWIKITSKRNNGKIEIFITDSGEGIPKDVKNQLFTPFFTTKDSASGTGLGLSLSREIVRKFGGDIQYLCLEGNTSFKVILSPA